MTTKLKTNRVELAPHTDEWMQGDRYGAIRSRTEKGEILVELDKSKRLVWFPKDAIAKEFAKV